MDLFRLVYCSTANDIARTDIEQILETARTRNAADHVTGMLVFADGTFTQLLEGPRERVTGTFLRIAQDRRHGKVELILAGRINARLFQDWSMRYLGSTGDAARIMRRFQASDRFDITSLADDAIDHFFAEAMMLNESKVAATDPREAVSVVQR